MNNTKKFDLKKIVGISIFSALAFVVALVCNVIPPVQGFLSLDVKDALIAIASFIYGPVSAILISFIAAFIELITFSTTGWYGFVMNFASSAVFSLTASLIYNRFRSINGALSAFFSAIIATTGVMLLLNIFVTPIYLASPYVGMPSEIAHSEVMQMLPTILLPFNATKALLNSAVAMLLYKPLTVALTKAGIVKGKSARLSFNKYSIVILVIGVVALAMSILSFIIIDNL